MLCYRSHSLNYPLILTFNLFNYRYTYTFPASHTQDFLLPTDFLSVEWEPCLGIPYSTPIMPQGLLVLLLRNKLIKRNSMETEAHAKSSEKHRRKRFEMHLITKMSDMTRCFVVILTSFSSGKCNGQFKFKIKWLFTTSANELVRAR